MVLMANSSFLMQIRRDRAVLSLEGVETENFLHNLVTADVLGLAEGEARYGALLTPQGKVLFDFFVVKTAGGYLLDCAALQLEELAKRLMFYRLRAKVTIAEVEHLVEAGEIEPDLVHTPSVYVKRIFQGEQYERRIERRTVRKVASDQ